MINFLPLTQKTCNTETGGKEAKQIEATCPNYVFYIDTVYYSIFYNILFQITGNK